VIVLQYRRSCMGCNHIHISEKCAADACGGSGDNLDMGSD